MAEAIATLLSDSESALVQTRYAVVFASNKGRKRFPENCVTLCLDEAQARALAAIEQGKHAAVVSGPSRSSEGFHLYYLLHWLD